MFPSELLTSWAMKVQIQNDFLVKIFWTQCLKQYCSHKFYLEEKNEVLEYDFDYFWNMFTVDD